MFSASTLSLGLALLASPVFGQTVHSVIVGGSAGLAFTPQAISAQVGDVVTFTFQQKNHTVTQSSLANPCAPVDGGFDSGYHPVPADQTDGFDTYNVTVQDTKPIWVFCNQAHGTAASHCGQGMVFAINCGADGDANSFTNFKNAALAVGASLASAAPSATSSGYGYSYPTGGSGGSGTTQYAAYGGYTVPPAPTASTVTQTITLSTSTWTTTYASYPNSPNPTPASLSGNVIQVVVGGNNGLTFDPPHVAAQPMDTIQFVFKSKNHTVTQSAFADPCRMFTDSNGQHTGFDSGFMPVAAGLTDGFPTWNLTVNTTAPTWAYCRQKTPASHCGTGMVFAINSDETSQRNYAAFQTLAKEMNGTANLAASASGSAPASSSTAKSGATTVRVGSAGVLGAVVLAFAALL